MGCGHWQQSGDAEQTSVFTNITKIMREFADTGVAYHGGSLTYYRNKDTSAWIRIDGTSDFVGKNVLDLECLARGRRTRTTVL